jgi:hypothetical protein
LSNKLFNRGTFQWIFYVIVIIFCLYFILFYVSFILLTETAQKINNNLLIQLLKHSFKRRLFTIIFDDFASVQYNCLQTRIFPSYIIKKIFIVGLSYLETIQAICRRNALSWNEISYDKIFPFSTRKTFFPFIHSEIYNC